MGMLKNCKLRSFENKLERLFFSGTFSHDYFREIAFSRVSQLSINPCNINDQYDNWKNLCEFEKEQK